MTTKTKAAPAPRNGVDTPDLLATINAVASQPELVKFKFTASVPLNLKFDPSNFRFKGTLTS